MQIKLDGRAREIQVELGQHARVQDTDATNLHVSRRARRSRQSVREGRFEIRESGRSVGRRDDGRGGVCYIGGGDGGKGDVRSGDEGRSVEDLRCSIREVGRVCRAQDVSLVQNEGRGAKD